MVRPKESCGNAGAMESVESQRRAFPSSHSSLGISQTARDSHIPTAPIHAVATPARNPARRTVGGGKVEIQNQDSHFPTAPIACGARKGKDEAIHRNANSSLFMIILGLENAAALR